MHQVTLSDPHWSTVSGQETAKEHEGLNSFTLQVYKGLNAVPLLPSFFFSLGFKKTRSIDAAPAVFALAVF